MFLLLYSLCMYVFSWLFLKLYLQLHFLFVDMQIVKYIVNKFKWLKVKFAISFENISIFLN